MIVLMFEQRDLLSLVLKRRKTIFFLIFFNSVKWMIVNVTKLAPVSPENTLVLDQSSEEGFDL